MKISQCDKILEYMKKHSGITQLEAFVDIGCWRLASRINDLKRQGYPIRREMITVKNRDKEDVQIARYSLREESDANNRVQSSGQ